MFEDFCSPCFLSYSFECVDLLTNKIEITCDFCVYELDTFSGISRMVVHTNQFHLVLLPKPGESFDRYFL